MQLWCPVCGHAVIPSNSDVLYCTHKSKHALEYNVYGALMPIVPPEVLVDAPAPQAIPSASAKVEIPPAPKVQPIGKKGAK